MWIIIGLIAVGVLIYSLSQRELFRIVVRDGKVVSVKDRPPQRLLNEIAEMVARPPVSRCTVKGVRDEGAAHLVVSGDIDEGRVQRMLNVFALYPPSRLRVTAREQRTARRATWVAIHARIPARPVSPILIRAALLRRSRVDRMKEARR